MSSLWGAKGRRLSLLVDDLAKRTLEIWVRLCILSRPDTKQTFLRVRETSRCLLDTRFLFRLLYANWRSSWFFFYFLPPLRTFSCVFNPKISYQLLLLQSHLDKLHLTCNFVCSQILLNSSTSWALIELLLTIGVLLWDFSFMLFTCTWFSRHPASLSLAYCAWRYSKTEISPSFLAWSFVVSFTREVQQPLLLYCPI